MVAELVQNNLRVFIKNNWSDTSFIEMDILDATNARSEHMGLGTFTFSVLLDRYVSDNLSYYDGSKKATSGKKSLKNKTTYINCWVFVVNSNLIVPTSDHPITDSTYEPASNHATEIIWTGFISNVEKQIQVKSNDCKGTMTCLELGHYVNKNKIRYELGCENGYNPVLNDRVIGNKDALYPYADYGTYEFQRTGRILGTNITTEPTKYWTVKEVIGYLCMSALEDRTLHIIPDFSNVENIIEGLSNGWLLEPETIPSYAGDNLNSALDGIIDSLTWTYGVDTNDNFKIIFKDKNKGNNNWVLDTSVEDLYILSEEQKYTKLKLRGDRILWFNSMSTYTPSDVIGIQKDWLQSEVDNYVSPISGYNYNIDNIETYVNNKLSDKVGGLQPNEKDTLISYETEKVLNMYAAERDKYKNVYRKFKIAFCDPNDAESTEGECAATLPYPGKYSYVTDAADVADKAIPLYPYVKIQDSTALDNSWTYDEASNHYAMLKTPIETINKVPEIEDALVSHQTPIPTEFKYFDYLVDDVDVNVNIQPKVWYRSLGKIQGFPTYTESGSGSASGKVIAPIWIDASKAGNGLQSFGIEFNMDNIKLDISVPETMASPVDDLFMDVMDNGTYNMTVKDFGISHKEWQETGNAGASKYDPFLAKNTYLCIGSWARWVCSFGSYSNQRIEFEYGYDDSNTLVIDDDTYGMTVVNKGYVYSQDAGPHINYSDPDEPQQGAKTLNWNTSIRYVKNDLEKMATRMQVLWDFYNREKRAVKVTSALYTNDGKINSPLAIDKMNDHVGTYISTIQDVDGTSYEVNSFISSVEYDFSQGSPRIILQTEYPASPSKTRNRILKSVFKDRKGDY